ncbi:tRNA (adenosine(37)-N6)-dimethylallyltransferase MiaA [Rhodothermus marinus]|uniref:tRNA (adenosine(37)-N6)-dimethylallyltransferase MiaA n=1 Tax=Rhodothermus marinus TaxID=29549 RepID=UPI0012BA3E50|nr:tRNA (adenosine(37)-N6)-dimethylallyltransferase MiaA [Rhodothermus marinus]BBM69543.1 tRNA dimethylallyltransferase [Rhodothermus marinus]BBM72525.1 tRNA dimethylallyltransferase [Rhodothermus marinus]
MTAPKEILTELAAWQRRHLSEQGPFLILAGPTAVGKTDLSLELAEALQAEIISADSRQIYRQMTIGTAKPPHEALQRVRHHFIDELDLDEPFSAGHFAFAAWERIGEILSRGHVPLVVGGSTLYLYALQFGLAEIPDVDPAVRRWLNERIHAEGPEALYAELQRVDPEAAARLDSTKTQRVIRALEVYHGTGRPITYYHRHHRPSPYTFRTIVLYRDRPVLYERINRRVDQMLAAGLVEEVRGILEAGYSPDLDVLRTIGYEEVIGYLQGAYDRETMRRLIQRNTRRYAKRQLTWFRRFDFEWIKLD